MTVKTKLEAALRQLVDTEKSQTSSDASRQDYVALHQDRFADIVRLCQHYVASPASRVLDVGRSELTAHLLKSYPNLTTLGIDLRIDDGGHRELMNMETVPHITFNLLDSHRVESWPECDVFDLIVFSEVLEHLSIASEFVFALLNSLLADSGILICTTPNAADIARRVRLACGRNPTERIRLYSANPGHIREYTRDELLHAASNVGLRCIRHYYFDWPQSNSGSRIKIASMKLIRSYPPFRRSSVAVFERMLP